MFHNSGAGRVQLRTPAAATEASSSNQLNPELLYLFYRYVRSRGGGRLADALRTALDSAADEHSQTRPLLPARIDVHGRQHRRSFAQFEASFGTLVGADLLDNVFRQVCGQASQQISSLRPSTSVVAAAKRLTKPKSHHSGTPGASSLSHAFSPVVHLPIDQLLRRRQMGGRRATTGSMQRSTVCYNYRPHARVFGHLSPVFCVCFDRSGRYVFTGADDNLVKLWSVADARLLYTFRASSGEIADLSVSHENTLLAAASVDKLVRVWCLRTGALQAVLHGHTAMVTAVLFLQPMHPDQRWLVSTGNECNVCFWKCDASTLQFDQTPVKFNERSNSSAQMLCMSSSPGGTLVATGATDHCIRIYRIDDEEGPVQAHEVEAHADGVDSLVWCHSGLRFVSGSKDGVAKIWRYERQQWHYLQLNIDALGSGTGSTDAAAGRGSKTRPRVCMVCWTSDDAFVLTSHSDAIRVWHSLTAHFVHELKGHTGEAYVLQPHPLNPDVIMTAAHDGMLFVWQVSTAQPLSRYENHQEGSGHTSFFDGALSPEADEACHIVAVDALGYVSILGLNTNERAKAVTSEQFFHTDYRPIVRDAAGFVLDEQTQLAPNLMPPPFLVNHAGEPWSAEHQRHVPGKERCNQAYLQPHVVRPTDDPWVAVIVDGESSTSSVDSSAAPAEVGAAGSTPSVCAWAQGRHMVEPLDEHTRARCTQIFEERTRAERLLCEREANREPLLLLGADPTAAPGASGAASRSAGRDDRATRRQRGRRDQADDVDDSGSPRMQLMLVPRERTRRRRLQRQSNSWLRLDEANNNNDNAEHSSNDDSRAAAAGEGDRSGSGDGPGSSSEDGDDDDTSDTDYEHEEPSTRRRRRASEANEGEGEEEEEPQPGTSGQQQQATARPANRRRRSPHKRYRSSQSADALEPVYLQSFPSHMFNVELQRFPYVPQIGDDVVYFRLGHEEYLRKVEQNQLYPVSRRMHPRQEFDAEEFAKVIQVRYVLAPYRLCAVRMAQIHWKTHRPSGFEYTIMFHDMDGSLDFLILRQHYERSLLPKYKPGDRMRAIIDSQWWCGHVDKKEPLDTNFPRAHWQSLIIRWDTGEDERLSPWEMEPVNGAVRSKTKATKADERSRAAYEPAVGDWPGDADTAPADCCQLECQRLENAIEMLSVLDHVCECFVNPVDLTQYPDYPAIVAYPIDLQTIRHRLTNRYYRRAKAVRWDVQQLLLNALAFNEPNSDIVRWARLLVETLLRFIDDPTNEDVLGLYERVSYMDTKDLTLCAATVEQFEHERQAKREKGSRRQSEAAWLQDCLDVMDSIVRARFALPFLNINDDVDFAADELYDTSIDLPSIVDRLRRSQYGSPAALSEDVEHLVANCKRLAPSKRSPLFQASLRLQSTFKEQLAPVLDRWRRHHQDNQQQQAEPSSLSAAGSSGHISNGHLTSPRRQLRNRRNRHQHVYNTRTRTGEASTSVSHNGTRQHSPDAASTSQQQQPSRARRTNSSPSPPPHPPSSGSNQQSPARPSRSSSQRRQLRQSSAASDDDDDDDDAILLSRPAKQPRMTNGGDHEQQRPGGGSRVLNGGGRLERRSSRHAGRKRPPVDYRDSSEDEDDDAGGSRQDSVSRAGRVRRPVRHF